jgi:hypothetical protein
VGKEDANRILAIRHADPFTYGEWEELSERLRPVYPADICVSLLIDRRAIEAPTSDFTRSVAVLGTSSGRLHPVVVSRTS